MDAAPRTGRRPGNPDTRAQILDAARAQFLEHGFQGTSIRGIARAAGVDPALIHRWFDDKGTLFLASIEAGINPVEIIGRLVSGPTDHLGHRIAQHALSLWDSPVGADLFENLRGNPGMLPVLMGFLNDPINEAAKRVLNLSGPEARLRVCLIESVMSGFVMTRYIARVEPLASLAAPEVMRLLGPLLQHVLSDDVGATTGRRPPSLPH